MSYRDFPDDIGNGPSDMLVYGNDLHEYDKSLRKTLLTLIDHNVLLKKNQCIYIINRQQ